MDNFTIHMSPLPRQFPHLLPVETIGYVPHKSGWVCHPFNSVNFSFIFSGCGEYRHPLGTWRVEAPCVITQWPGIYLEYGPDREWEELYLIYPQELEGAFRKRNLIQPEKPLWTINDPGPTSHLLHELIREIESSGNFGSADRIDRICENMILESFIAEQVSPEDEHTGAVNRVRIYLEEHLNEAVDVDELALEQGFSPSHFRRIWNERVPHPPGRYVMHMRMRQACRMLVETSLPVGRIARELGYADPLYFSRKFRQIIGRPATQYREAHRWPLSLMEDNGPVNEKVDSEP